MRATLVLLGLLLYEPAVAGIAIGTDRALGAGNGCTLYIAGGNSLYPAAAIGAKCGNGTIWDSPDWPPEKMEEVYAWSRENRVLERVLAGEAVTIPDEYQRR